MPQEGRGKRITIDLECLLHARHFISLLSSISHKIVCVLPHATSEMDETKEATCPKSDIVRSWETVAFESKSA